MDRRGHLSLWLCGLALVAGAGCDNDDLGTLTPQIAVSACDGGAVEVDGAVVGGVRDCSIGFGAVAFSQPRSYGLVIVNPSTVTLRIADMQLLEGTDPAFELESFPSEVAAGRQVPVPVWFRPTVASDVTGTLRITTDADNAPIDGDAGLRHLDVELAATGVDGGDITVSVTPPACDFGARGTGSTSICNVDVAATGDADILLSDMEITGDAAFGFVSLAPEVVPAGTGTTIGVTFAPTAVIEYAGTLRFGTNDPTRATVEVPLTGTGSDGPVCEVTITAVNGQLVSGGTPMVEPLDDVALSVQSSDPSATTAWSFVARPAGSAVEFVAPAESATGFVFDGTKYGVDVAGEYRVRAVQTDAAGQTGSCDLAFSAVPTDELLVQLTWTTPVGDVDLHLIQEDPQGRYCARSVEAGPLAEDCGATVIEDCYFWSCKPANSLRPDWDGDGAVGTGGDPSLDVDDRCGYGPEHINVDFPVAGRYLLGIDHFGFSGCAGSGPADVTVRVYAYGQLAGEWFKTMVEGDWWEVAVIDWPAQSGAVCLDDLAVNGDECP